MPLSDREQQILQEIERNLLEDDPSARPAASPRRRSRDQIKLGVVVFVIGLVCLALFFATSALFVGVIAFAAMVGGLVLIGDGIRAAAVRGLLEGRSSGRFGHWEQRFRDRRDRR